MQAVHSRRQVSKCEALPAGIQWIFGVNTPFVEGNQEQYRFFVPHDLPGLLGLFKSPQTYVDALSNMFEFAKLDKCAAAPDACNH